MSTQSIHNIQITCPYIKSMKIQNTPQATKAPPISTPPIYLPLWQQSTKKEGEATPGVEKRSRLAGCGDEAVGVVVKVVGGGGRHDGRSRRSSRSRLS